MTDVQHMPAVGQEEDEAERAWRLQQQMLGAGDDSNGSGETAEGDDDDDEEAERAWQAMQQRFVQENEEAQQLEEIRQRNELASSNPVDDDDGIYKGELTIPFDSLVFEKQPVGGGNFGKIFKGDYLGAEVAIKKFAFEDDAKYVEREVSVLRAIRHPNIVTFLGACQHSSGLYVVTEWVAKGDLAHELQRNQKISWRQKLLWIKDACSAFAYLHELGIIHRDIKPDNLLITDNGRIKVCDLGFARTAKRSRQRMSIAGTGQYMAPEVMTGDKYDSKVDVFSFGAVLLELITRQQPPKRSVGSNFHFDFAQLRSLVPADCPNDLLDICLDCLLPNPDERPTMKELLPRITQILNTLPLDVAEDSKSEEQRRREEEAERAFLLEAEKSLKENQSFLEAVKEIEAEQALALAGAKEDMEKKLKEAIEKEVEQRLREEKRRLREEMKKELETTKAQLTASFSAGSLTEMLVTKNPRRNSLDLAQVREVRKDLEKESRKLKKEEKELKKEEEKKKKLEQIKKKRQEEMNKARQSWGPSSRRRKEKDLEHNHEPPKGTRPDRSLSSDAALSSQTVAPKKKDSKEPKKEEKKQKEKSKKEKRKEKRKEKKEREKKEKEAKKEEKKGTKKAKFALGGRKTKQAEKKGDKPSSKEDGKVDEKLQMQLTTSGELYG